MRTGPFLCALVALLVAAAAAQCYTALLEADADSIYATAPGADPARVWRFNARTVHAAALITGGAEALLIAAYDAAPNALTLERYDLASGALLDSVPLARDPALPAPAKMCATAYDLYVLEADGTLAHYLRTTGAAAALAATAPATARDLACTTTRLFALTGAAVLELDPADALPLDMLLTLPAGGALAALPDNTLVLQLGRPAAYALVYDLAARAVVAFNPVTYAVATTDAPPQFSGSCVLHALSPARGVVGVARPPLVEPCVALTPNASLVAAEGLLWAVVGDAATPLGGALLNGGNLRDAAAIAPDADDPALFTVVAADGAAAVLRYDGARLALVRRAASLAGARPLRLLGVGHAGLAWLDGAGAVWGRGAGAVRDFALPPLGGAVFDARWRDAGALCVLMSSEVQCFDASSSAGAVRSTVVLPAALHGRAQGVALAQLGGELVLLDLDASGGRAQRLRAHEVAGEHAVETCSARLAAPCATLGQVDAPLSGAVAVWLDGVPQELVALRLDNCTAARGASRRYAGPAVAFAVGAPGGRCLLAAQTTRHRAVPTWPLKLIGALTMCCAICLCTPIIAYNVMRKAVIRRRAGKRSRVGRVCTSSLRRCQAMLCCCLPPQAYNAITDALSDDASVAMVPVTSHDGLYTVGGAELSGYSTTAPSSLLSDTTQTPTTSTGTFYAPPQSRATSVTPFENVALGVDDAGL